jgi:hypothetical protein
MTNEQQRSPIFCLDKVKKHLYNTIWGIKQLLMQFEMRRDDLKKFTTLSRANAKYNYLQQLTLTL